MSTSGSATWALIDAARPPVGVIMPFAGPSGAALGEYWLFCDGSEYARSLYPDLSNALGTTYGGDTANFNVPDLRGRTLYGELAGEPSGGTRSSLASFSVDVSGVVGAAAMASSQMPYHNHTHTANGHSHTITDPGHTHTLTSTRGSLEITSGSSDLAEYTNGGVKSDVFTHGSAYNTTFGIMAPTRPPPGPGAEGQTGVTNQQGFADISIGYAPANSTTDAFLPPAVLVNYIIRCK